MTNKEEKFIERILVGGVLLIITILITIILW